MVLWVFPWSLCSICLPQFYRPVSPLLPTAIGSGVGLRVTLTSHAPFPLASTLPTQQCRKKETLNDLVGKGEGNSEKKESTYTVIFHVILQVWVRVPCSFPYLLLQIAYRVSQKDKKRKEHNGALCSRQHTTAICVFFLHDFVFP